jgi:hypothetical protein
MPPKPRMKPFAIYFPQFYPTATNDKAWGAGFTDWALVANANMRDSWPRRAPVAGFYDGASPMVHARQMGEAQAAQLGGFAIYHYWFYTHQELNAFERTMLSNAATGPSLPWFLIWATEGWSKRWLANPETLVHLSSAPTQDEIEVHCDYLATCFSHPAYTRWQGKPLFAWYNLGHFDRPESTVVCYREKMLERGFDTAMAHFVKNPFDLAHCAFTDASYLFEPRLFFGSQKLTRGNAARTALNLFSKLVGNAGTEALLVAMDRLEKSGTTHSAARFLAYMESAERAGWLAATGRPCQEVLSPGWNNTPRYGKRFTALEPLDPPAFGRLVGDAMRKSDLPPLLNAWNEWTEGAAIEPCAYLGRSHLDAVTEAVRANSPRN